MKKNLSLHKFLSLALILAMVSCFTACGCGRNVPNNTATESGMNNNGTGANNTTNSTNNNNTDNTMTTDPGITNGNMHETITHGTDGLLGDTVDGVMNGVNDVVDGVENGMGMNDNANNSNIIGSVTSETTTETTTETSPTHSSDTRNHTR